MRPSKRASLQTFVVLLRGINVGSTRKVPMADLRAICLKLGWTRPETYIQSGNLIVDARGNGAHVRRVLEPELVARFGLAVDVVVRGASNWVTYVAANPFANDAAAKDKMVHLYVSRDPLTSQAADVLNERARTGERIHIAGGALWIDYGAPGVAGSKLTPSLIDKACGSPTTGRNWKTVLKIREMLAARNKA
ncbi:MAG: DUF1697 domain-containing protein [Xanthobacteraceae bacterium]|nr:DUF1697 domain-containing protein [Xanthobacteraceae bacterium]